MKDVFSFSESSEFSSAAAIALWDVLAGTRSLSGERGKVVPMNMAVGAESDFSQSMDLKVDLGKEKSRSAAASNSHKSLLGNGTPGGVRTPNLLIRRTVPGT